MNTKNGFYSFIFVIFLLGKGLNATITQGPLNSVAEIGKQVKLNCTANDLIGYWFLSKNGETSGELKIAGPGCSAFNPAFVDHYSVELLDGGKTCNLIVSNITMEQAGVYRCLEGSADSSSILTVLESSPVITVNSTTSIVENESVLIECTLNHKGSVMPAPTLQPYFYWTNSSVQNISSFYDLTTNDAAVSQLRVIAGRQNITAYTCHVYLQLIPTANPNYANNTPAVSSSSSSSAIDVLYSPSIPVITSGYQIITIDGIACEVSNVTCTSHGNPSPVFEWFDPLENVSLIRSSNFDLAEINRKYTCVASNTIRNEKLSSITFHVPKNGSTTKTCRFPHSESTWINVTGIDDGTGGCSKGYDGLNFTCNTDTHPNASYQWTGADNSQVYSQVYKNITVNGIYSCTAYFNQSTSNYTGSVMFTNGTSEENVTECSAPPMTPSTTASSTISSKSTTIFESTSTTMQPISELSVGAAIGIAIGCILVVNILATSLFIVYYNKVKELHPGTNGRIVNAKMEHNKLTLNKSFPWLQKMLPCLNVTKESTGNNCLWISLFILLATLTGILTFPICILLAKRFEKSQGSSALTNRENCDENGRTENGRSANSSLSSIQAANPSNAVHDENPYQNCQTEGIELQQSKTRLLLNSASHGTPSANKPQLPLKPNSQSFNKTDRAMNYTVPQGVTISNREGRTATTNKDQATYGEIFFNRRTNDPVQLLVDGPEDHYASLKKV